MNTGAVRASLVLWSIAAGLMCACAPPTAPLPEGSRRFSVPSVFREWWTMAESCSGNTGDLRSIDWWLVPGVAQFAHEGTMVSGLWTGENRVIIAEGAVRDGRLVRHEMLHALIRKPGHTREAFLENCGGTVVCLLGCLEDAGPAPVVGPSVTRVQPGEMQVDVTIHPARPDRRINDGNFRLRVTVTNPRTDSVFVMLPSSGGVPPESFNFRVSGGRNGVWFTEHAWDPGVLVFAPGASRHAIFDFTVADHFDGFRALPGGTYEVRGGFGPATSVSRTFVVTHE